MKLEPITTDQKFEPFAVTDIETMNWTKFLLLGYYDGEKYLEFRSLKKFIKYICENKTPETIFAHFGGKFDFLFILEALLKEKKIPTSIVPRGSSILFMEIILSENKKIVFRDSSALLPFSLRSITENFGTDHKKGEWDHTKTKGYSKELSEYCRLDCISLYEALRKFYDWPIIKRAGQAYTIAGQAMRVQRTFLKDELWGLCKSATIFARPAYLGGRTEIFRPLCEKGPIYEYDVNSLYPYVMRNNFYPFGRSYNVFDFDDSKLGIYHAKVVTPDDIYIPCLGIIRNNKYVFPQGEFSGYWTSAELSYAKSLGYKIDIKFGIVFYKKEKLFSSFITEMYNIRKTSPKNSVSDIIAKLIMNSSYGRYGLNPEKENISFDLKAGNKEFKDILIDKKIVQLFKEPVNLKTFTHVAIAAFVTSYARIHMHKLFSQLGTDLYYTDTDSIWTTRQMPTGIELGELKLEGEYESAVFLLPKTYLAKGLKKKLKMKGFDSKKIQHFEYKDFKNALEGDISRLKVENEPKFATLKQAIAQKKLITMSKANTKQLKSKYDKRIIFKKGREFFTKPITIKE